jgi:hypothetical protein
MATATPTFLTGDVIRAFTCNCIDSEDRLATAVVLDDNRVLQVFPYTREAPSWRIKKGAVLRKAFDSVEAWARSICEQFGMVELEVTSKVSSVEPDYNLWTLSKKVDPVDPMVLGPAPAEVGIHCFELDVLDKVNYYLDHQDIRTYNTRVSFLSDDKVLSTARIFYNKEYVERFNCYYDIHDEPYKSLENWFKAVRDGLYSEQITAVRVECEGYPTWTCFF